MTLCAIYPTGTQLPAVVPPARTGELHLTEAWPGSILTVPQFEDQDGTVPPQLLAFVLDFAGELPPGHIGAVFVLRPDEVADACRHFDACRPSHNYSRAEEQDHSAYYEPSPGNGPLQERALTTTCRMVEAWPGSLTVALGTDGQLPQLRGVAHSIEGDMPDRLLGGPLMLHLGTCAIRSGGTSCDCFELDEHGEPTGRRPR